MIDRLVLVKELIATDSEKGPGKISHTINLLTLGTVTVLSLNGELRHSRSLLSLEKCDPEFPRQKNNNHNNLGTIKYT